MFGPDDLETGFAAETPPRSTRSRRAVGSSGRPIEADLAMTLGELARELQAEPDIDALAAHIVASAVSEVDGADYGGISLVENKKVRTLGATHPMVLRLDHLQYELGDGPCLNSLRDQVTVRSDDLNVDERWPNWSARAVADGVGSILSVQLYAENDNLGALNLYAMRPNSFGEDAEHTAMAMASHAAVALKEDRVESNLRAAVLSRDLIGQAKGILMERYRINADDAFGLLVMSSQQTHTKLRDVAEHLSATGELPTPRRSRP